ncbi:MAG TPA: alpha/beta fold hydrolase [Nocardioidaceae bacterium]
MIRSRLLVAATAVAVASTTWAAGPGQAVTGKGVGGPSVTSDRGPAAWDRVAPGTTASRTSAVQDVTWGRCSSVWLRRARAQCGFVTVPLDHADPSGETLQIAVSRVRHTTRRSQGVMLINPGGPGAPGLEFAILGLVMPRGSGASYDWIGFDPRGVGESKPALSCQPNYFHADRPPYVPANQAELQTWLARTESYADACAKHGDLLDHMKTTDAAKDMDAIRQALGASRINYYGYSYGSYLGQVYATLFPSRVRRMVLDSNVDPTTVWYESGEAQTIALERVMNRFFRWIARHHKTYRLGRNADAVKRLYLRQRQVLRRQPAAGVLGPSEWDDALGVAGYGQAAWPVLAQGMARWVHRQKPRLLIRVWRLIDTPGDDNTYAAFNAVVCTDAPTPDEDTVIADARRLHRVAPVVTWPSTWFSAPCLYWPAEPGTPVDVDGEGVGALLLGQTLDGPTPFRGSLAVRSAFPESRLVAIRGGNTHGTTPDIAGPCAGARIAAYLKAGALPPRRPGRRADVYCPAPPLPMP